MAAQRMLISACINLAANLSREIKPETYLPCLTEDRENNYAIFAKFAGSISNSLLGVLYRLGHFGGDIELLNIAAETISMREAFRHEEEDVGGYAGYLLANHRRLALRGNYFISYTFDETATKL